MKRNQPPKAGTKPRDGAQQRSVLKQIDELNRMSMEQLRKRWVDLFGADPGRFGRNFLIRRLAYRIQELVYGGLSREARRSWQRTLRTRTTPTQRTHAETPGRKPADRNATVAGLAW